MRFSLGTVLGILIAVLLSACGAGEEAPLRAMEPAAVTLSGGQSAVRAKSFTTAPYELLTDPGFESPAGESWSSSSKVVTEDTRYARSGKRFAWLGGYTDAADYLELSVVVPKDLESLRFQFWYYYGASQTATGRTPDAANLMILDAANGRVLKTVATFTEGNASGTWQQSPVYDLTEFRGRAIRLRFFLQAWYGASFLLDDLSLTAVPLKPLELRLDGPRADYGFTFSNDNLLVTDKSGKQTEYQNVIRIHFSDSVLSFDSDSGAARLYRLYRAVFGRVPDLDGLGYWIETAEKASLSEEVIAAAFIGSQEYVKRYGHLNDIGFLTEVYNNVLGRAPDGAGIDFWFNKLSAKALSRTQVMLAFADSAENRTYTEYAVRSGIQYVPPSMVSNACAATHAIVEGLCVKRPRATSVRPGFNLQEPGSSELIRLTVEFDQGMAMTAIPSGVSISPAAPGNAWHFDPQTPNTVQLRRMGEETTANQLAPSTTYTITVAGSVAATTRATLGADQVLSYRTGAKCRFGVVSGQSCVPPVCVAPQTLDQEWKCVNTSCPAGQVLKNGRCEPKVTCVYPQLDFHNVCVVQTCQLPLVQFDGVCVRPDAQSGLTMVSSTPAANANVASGWYLGTPFKTLSATFNENLDPATVSQWSMQPRLASTGVAVPGDVSHNGTSMTFTARDPRGFAPGEYWVALNDSIRSVSGRRMGSANGWKLVVVPGFTVSPAPDTTTNNVNSIILVDFVNTMLASSFTTDSLKVWQTDSGAPVAGNLTLVAGKRAQFQPNSSLPAGTSISVMMTTGIKNAAGVALLDDYVWKFRTFGQAPIICTPPNVLEFGQCVPADCQLPKVLQGGQCVLPGSGTPGTGSQPDADGCFVPRRSPQCLAVESNVIDASNYHLVKYRNGCGARVYVKMCIKRRDGRQECGADGVANGSQVTWYSYNSSGSSSYQYTGSTKAVADWTCKGKDPLMKDFEG